MVKDEVKSGRTSDWKRHLFQDVLSRERQTERFTDGNIQEICYEIASVQSEEIYSPPTKKKQKKLL